MNTVADRRPLATVAVKPDWKHIRARQRPHPRLVFTPSTAVKLYLRDLLDSGLWGPNYSTVITNVLREGIIAVKNRGVQFPCEQNLKKRP